MNNVSLATIKRSMSHTSSPGITNVTVWRSDRRWFVPNLMKRIDRRHVNGRNVLSIWQIYNWRIYNGTVTISRYNILERCLFVFWFLGIEFDLRPATVGDADVSLTNDFLDLSLKNASTFAVIQRRGSTLFAPSNVRKQREEDLQICRSKSTMRLNELKRQMN